MKNCVDLGISWVCNLAVNTDTRTSKDSFVLNLKAETVLLGQFVRFRSLMEGTRGLLESFWRTRTPKE